ncbi:MAG TPA: methyltransferase domain-containing protein [Stellaceae bacterium]|nr:methyltransferase domain-containing protein [Stellaceae bacterium]
MTLIASDPANADMIEYWNGTGGDAWIARQEAQDADIALVTGKLLARAELRPDEHVIDIGCGTGNVTVEAIRLVSPKGRVLGVDISGPMLERAKAQLSGAGNVTLVQADATVYPFSEAAFNAAVSRMGVMFFAEPAKSFANIRRALRPGGRLAFACWRGLEENPWVSVPLGAARSHAPAQKPPSPDDPGPFSFGSESRVRGILGAAGFAEPAFERLDLERDLAQGCGLEHAVASAMKSGPVMRLFAKAPPEAVRVATEAVRGGLAPFARGDRVPMAAAVWIVTACNP